MFANVDECKVKVNSSGLVKGVSELQFERTL